MMKCIYFYKLKIIKLLATFALLLLCIKGYSWSNNDDVLKIHGSELSAILLCFNDFVNHRSFTQDFEKDINFYKFSVTELSNKHLEIIIIQDVKKITDYLTKKSEKVKEGNKVEFIYHGVSTKYIVNIAELKIESIKRYK